MNLRKTQPAREMSSSSLTRATFLICASVLTLALACAKTPDEGTTGSGGATSTGGKTGSGGAVGSGGAGTGSGGAVANVAATFPFPQNRKPAMCNLTSVAGASASTMTAYQSWRSSFVTSDGAGSGGMRVKRPGNASDTVSEGIGYGMLAAVYLGDKATFDGLWTYAKAQGDSYSSKVLMNWHIDSTGTPIKDNGNEPGSAADADEDIAWALLQAAEQWSTTSYLDDAKRVINAMFTYEIGSDGLFKPGDHWGSGDQHTFPDYFSPAYFRRFAAVTGNTNWAMTILDRNYDVIAKVGGTNGLVPDETTGTYMNTVDKYGYDACRAPWRIGMDYCFNNEPRALAYLMKIGAFFDAKGAANIVDGYTSSTGAAVGNNKNMAFIGTAGIAGMPSSGGFPTLLDDAFSFGAKTTSGDYFKDSLRVVTMLMMSGNLVDLANK